MKYMDIRMKYKKKKIMLALAVSTFCLLSGCQEKAQEDALATYEGENIEKEVAESLSAVLENDEVGTNATESEVVQEGENAAEQGKIPDGKENNKPKPVKVKGIYVSGPVAGIDRMDELIALVDETELNAIVIDIKNDEGRVTYKMQSEKVIEIEAGIRYIPDIQALVQKCKEKDIYLIARIVAFKDPYLAEKCPELAVKKKTGEIFKDKSGLAWVNPYKKEVWDYLIEVSKEAAKLGFDEIQYDYIRFSTDLKSDDLDFGPEAENKSKIEIISEFTQYACEALTDMNVYVSADVYGTIIDNKVDQKIVGQDYVEMASYLDYICPMVYPSHYGNGVYGIEIPDAEPYKTVNAAMNAAAKELSVLAQEDRAINRVWIQSFTATWVKGHITYGPDQIREQIRGAYDAGFDEWILWNASIKYQRDSLLTDEEAATEQEIWKQEKAEAERLAEEVAKAEEEKQAEEAAKSEAEKQTEEIAKSEAEKHAQEVAKTETEQQAEEAIKAETEKQTEETTE